MDFVYGAVTMLVLLRAWTLWGDIQRKRKPEWTADALVHVGIDMTAQAPMPVVFAEADDLRNWVAQAANRRAVSTMFECPILRGESARKALADMADLPHWADVQNVGE